MSETSVSSNSDLDRPVASGLAAECRDVPDAKLELPADAQPMSEQPVDERPNYSVFTTWQKRCIVLGAAIGAFFSPLTAQIYFPALNTISKELGVTPTQINLTVTTYMIFQGITPTFIGSFADSAGRRPAYFICFVIYLGANIGCALAPNYASLLVLRMLQSAGSSTTVALCQAVVADIITSGERGQYIGFTVVPIILAPSLGPVIGGVLAEYLGWRSIFWFLTILGGVVFILMVFFFPETCRRIVDDGSVRPPRAYRTAYQLIKDASIRRKRRNGTGEGNELSLQRTSSHATTGPTFKLSSYNPFSSLVILFEIEMFLLLMYSAIIFSGFYAIATAMPLQLGEIYGFSDVQIGLIYLPLAGGSVISAILNGKLLNQNYQRHCRKLGIPVDKKRQSDLSEFPIERARLEVGLPMLALGAALLSCWGWALQYRAHVAVLCVLLFIYGLGMTGFSNTMNILIIDIHPSRAGAATAANNLTRCLVGAAASAAVAPMIKGIGSGWTFLIFGILYLLGIPALLLAMKNGIKWRKAEIDRRQKKKLQKQEKKAATNQV